MKRYVATFTNEHNIERKSIIFADSMKEAVKQTKNEGAISNVFISERRHVRD